MCAVALGQECMNNILNEISHRGTLVEITKPHVKLVHE